MKLVRLKRSWRREQHVEMFFLITSLHHFLAARFFCLPWSLGPWIPWSLGLHQDEQVKSDKRFSLMGPMRRKYASVDSLWRSAVHLVLEQNLR